MNTEAFDQEIDVTEKTEKVNTNVEVAKAGLTTNESETIDWSSPSLGFELEIERFGNTENIEPLMIDRYIMPSFVDAYDAINNFNDTIRREQFNLDVMSVIGAETSQSVQTSQYGSAKELGTGPDVANKFTKSSLVGSYYQKIGKIESGNRYFIKPNRFGYTGRFQFRNDGEFKRNADGHSWG